MSRWCGALSLGVVAAFSSLGLAQQAGHDGAPDPAFGTGGKESNAFGSGFTAALGEAWVQSGSSLLLRVPSAVLPLENNYLINPRYASFGQLQLQFGAAQAFEFDPRLF